MYPLGPHGVRTAPNGMTWASQATIVKGLDNLDYLTAAPASAVRIFRHYFPSQNLDDYRGTGDAIISALQGYRHPNLYVELWNEATPTLTQLTAIMSYLHQQQIKVAGGSYSTGSYNQASFALVRDAGCDAIAVHCYWDPGVLDQWEAYRFASCWQPGDPPVVVTECGRRYGNHDAAELATFARALTPYPYVLGAVVFANRPYNPFAAFETEELIPSLLPLLQGGPPVFSPPPLDTFDVGPGVRAAMHAHGDQPIADEEYKQDHHGQTYASETYGERGICHWIKRTDTTYYTPFP